MVLIVHEPLPHGKLGGPRRAPQIDNHDGFRGLGMTVHHFAHKSGFAVGDAGDILFGMSEGKKRTPNRE